MLTSEQSIVVYDRGQAIPDRLMRQRHGHYTQYARRMIEIYRQGTGKARRELHRQIAGVFAAEADCDRRRIASFCKLLDDASEYDIDRKGESAKLRLRVFELAARYHPLVTEPDKIFERSETEAKQLIATELSRPWDEIDAALYADVIELQRLISFEPPGSPEELLSRYNLGQLQACLYRAMEMTVTLSADFAAVVRWAKLAHLLVQTRRISEGQYRIDLSGPASVLHETRRYGINFARFAGALVSAKQWAMRATVITRWGRRAVLELGSKDGYRSHVPAPNEFDSSIEESLAKKWGDEPREGWRLIREAGILQHGQATFVPDFLLRHEDGREVFLEIVGFWTPEYLAAKRKTIALFSNRRILLAVQARTAKDNADEMPGVIVYKTVIKPEKVVEAAEGVTGSDQLKVRS